MTTALKNHDIKTALIAQAAYLEAEHDGNELSMRVWGRRMLDVRHVFEEVGHPQTALFALIEMRVNTVGNEVAA